MVIIKKNTNNKCWQGRGENCWWECKLVQARWKAVWRFWKKIKNRTTIWSWNSTPGYVSKNNKTPIWKDTWTPMSIAALCTTAKIWKQAKCPSINEWIKKMWCVYTRTHTHTHTHTHTIEYYSAVKGEGNGNPLQYSCLENSIDRGAWWATVHGVPKNQTRLSTHVCSSKKRMKFCHFQQHGWMRRVSF